MQVPDLSEWGFLLALAARMRTPGAFLVLSTRVMTDLRDWTKEASNRDVLSPEDLKSLQEAADTVERVTLVLAETAAATTEDAVRPE